MSGRLNARQMINDTAHKHGWARVVGDLDGEIWAKGERRIAISYKMFGTPNNYICRYYGKDPSSGINWGVDSAALNDGTLITGRNKKGQIMKLLKA